MDQNSNLKGIRVMGSEIEAEKVVVSQCSNRIVYSCGCICEFQLIGQFAKQKEWHIVACFEHCKDIPALERQADSDWERITSEVRS